MIRSHLGIAMRLAVATACVLAALNAAHATNLSFLQGAAIDSFNDEDIRLLTAAFDAVAADTKTPATRTWKNDATGNSGELQTLVAFAGPKGERCKRLRVINHAKKNQGTGKSLYTVCEMPDGWQLVPSDYAPIPKSK